MKRLMLFGLIASLAGLGACTGESDPATDEIAETEEPILELEVVDAAQTPESAAPPAEPLGHPDSSDWPELFDADLGNAVYPDGVWYVEDGVLTANEDQGIWTEEDYENFVLDLEFKNGHETNSGVFVYCSDIDNWVPNSVEVQIADDYAERWAESPKSWQCGAIFGHLPANEQQVVNPPGEWNRMTVYCRGQQIDVVLNGQHITSMDMALWTSAETNPDGSEIPSWLSKPKAELPTVGRIGFQGKHGGAPIYFRNIRVNSLG